VSIDINKIRSDFPVLKTKVYGKPLVYMDNGATTQKPQLLIDFLADFYSHKNSSIHRGVHVLSGGATEAYENARETVRQTLNAAHKHEIVFTSGATGSINLLAYSFGEQFINAGDEIIISAMEHHANIVPWQLMCQRKNARLKILPIDVHGELIVENLVGLITPKTKLIAIVHISNMLGTVNDIKAITKIAKAHNIPVLADGAQAIQHGKVDVQELGVDFYAFSGHKVFGPTGIGVLYGKEDWLEALPPYQGGGDMVDKVSFEQTTFNELPFKFEAGTTNYVGAIGLGKALEYVRSIGVENIARYEKGLLEYGTKKLQAIDGLRIYGTAAHKIPTFSFLLDKVHAYDAGMVLDKMGIAVRTGTHCTQPLMQYFGIDGTVRASLTFYNTTEEIDQLAEGLQKVKMMFG
jgi:cysteine desulfurase / selenocysteine lyase